MFVLLSNYLLLHLSQTCPFTHVFVFILTGPYYRPLSPTLPFIPYNIHSPSSALMCTLIIVSCTVYPQGDQCCADAPSLIALRDHPLRHLQHVLHRPLSSCLALLRNSPLLLPTLSHHLSLPCLSCLPLYLNTTVLLSHQTFTGLLHNIPALTVYIAPSSYSCFHLSTLWCHPY